jgi:simple sugar transport system ATP-binding protein
MVLLVRGLGAKSNRGLPALKDVSFEVCAGEILGIAGVAGNGQSELAEVITGLRSPTTGGVMVSAQSILNGPIYRHGIGHIPEDRLGTGLARSLSLIDNLAMKGYRHAPLSWGLLLNRGAFTTFAAQLIKQFKIAVSHPDVAVETLSGGNLQKAILAREIPATRGLLVAVHPTQGLDIGATEQVHELLLELRSKGIAVLLISEDLDEVMALSDRIAVMFEGQIVDIVNPQLVSLEEVGLMMAGVHRQGERL